MWDKCRMYVILQLFPNSSDCGHPLPQITILWQISCLKLDWWPITPPQPLITPPPSALPALQRPAGDLTSSGERPPLHCALPSSCRPQNRETRPTLWSHDLGYFPYTIIIFRLLLPLLYDHVATHKPWSSASWIWRQLQLRRPYLAKQQARTLHSSHW